MTKRKLEVFRADIAYLFPGPPTLDDGLTKRPCGGISTKVGFIKPTDPFTPDATPTAAQAEALPKNS